MGNGFSLFTGLMSRQMDSAPEDAQSTDLEQSMYPVLTWCEITWKGWDNIVRTIQGAIYKEWPNVIGIHPWGNKDDYRGIVRDHIIHMERIPKPDPRDLLEKKSQFNKGEKNGQTYNTGSTISLCGGGL